MRHDIYLHLVIDEQGGVTPVLSPVASAGTGNDATQSAAPEAPVAPVDVPAPLSRYFRGLGRMSDAATQGFFGPDSGRDGY